MKYINFFNLRHSFLSFHNAKPFNYCIIDNFFVDDIAKKLSEEFPSSDSDVFNGIYFNQIENKKTCNIWDRFPETTYNVLQYLNSNEFLTFLESTTNTTPLYADFGLHGGGWHIHPPGGKLNVHLDYNIHPKMKLQRKFNLLVYLNPNYKSDWGGELGLWSSENNKPKDLVKKIEPIFNRAIFFDTTQNSWHGLEIPNNFPNGQDRKSIAMYYLTDSKDNTSSRNRALFYPSKDQENDKEVLDLIKRRSEIKGEDPTKWSRQ
jgi:Rps23 Pro-64 3,4-dihydroxylase Tpa1-like proline 4-hydroxylase